MCGRFAYFGGGVFGYEPLHLPQPPPYTNYNVAPSQEILVVLNSPETKQNEWKFLQWGLVPFWSKTAKTKYPLINARGEGIEKRPSFRGPFKTRRCIIPVNGVLSGNETRRENNHFLFVHAGHTITKLRLIALHSSPVSAAIRCNKKTIHMVTKFKEWWNRPLQTKDRVLATVIGGIGGFWVGILGRLFLGSMPMAITTLGYWAIGAIIVGAILGIMFPKPVTVVLFPFSILSIGGS